MKELYIFYYLFNILDFLIEYLALIYYYFIIQIIRYKIYLLFF